MTAHAHLVADLREAAADRQHLGVNADRFTRAADAIEELRSEMNQRELHHFESEQAMEEAVAAIESGRYTDAHHILWKATR